MTPEERNELRLSVLKELYDFHFANNGRSALFKIESDEDKEKLLALEYLDGKGLANHKIMYKGAYDAKITSYGIDLIETNGSLR